MEPIKLNGKNLNGFRRKKYLQFAIKTAFTLIGILLLKVLEMVVFQRIIHWYWNIPMDGKDELIDVVVLIMIMAPFIFIVMRQKKSLIEAEEKYKVLAEDSLIGIYSYDDGKITYVNNRLLEILGYKREEIVGKDFHELVVLDDHPKVVQTILRKLNGKEKSSVLQIRVIKKDKTIIDVEAYCTISIKGGKPSIIGSILEISERIKNEKTLENLAFFDQLTGLPNRKYFENELKKLFLNKSNTAISAVMFMDLDGFKEVNDFFGHQAGDLLLKEMANRISSCVRAKDMVSRFAGDEFMIFLPNIHLDQVNNVATRIKDAVNLPFSINGSEIFVSSSIGIAFYPEHGKDPEKLIGKADKAMYQAKLQGKNTFCILK